MIRRRFLALLAGAAAAPYTLDPERLLWVPGKKRIFLPAATSLPLHEYRLHYDTILSTTLYVLCRQGVLVSHIENATDFYQRCRA